MKGSMMSAFTFKVQDCQRCGERYQPLDRLSARGICLQCIDKFISGTFQAEVVRLESKLAEVRELRDAWAAHSAKMALSLMRDHKLLAKADAERVVELDRILEGGEPVA